LKAILGRGYVAVKQMTGLWRFVTRIEKKFYQRGTWRVVEANKLAQQGLLVEAEKVLQRRIPSYLKPATSIIHANIHFNNPARWLQHLNDYFLANGQASVTLVEGVTRFHQLSCTGLQSVNDGPLVTVIMATHNSASTVSHSMMSILNQTWRNLELIVVDDASSDKTPDEVARIAAMDGRVTFVRHNVNAGPYVCKNVVLHKRLARGDYITCHDADDWAHPQRLEAQMAFGYEAGARQTASLGYCLRMNPEGQFTRIGEPRTASPNGVSQIARVSCLFERNFLLSRLGYWDCSRFGADSEIIARAEFVTGKRLPRFNAVGMICLDTASNLSSHHEHGVKTQTGLSPARKQYKLAYEKWHSQMGNNTRLTFPLRQEFFVRPAIMDVSDDTIRSLIGIEIESTSTTD
jgi:hypothetical protein